MFAQKGSTIQTMKMNILSTTINEADKESQDGKIETALNI
jgi:hypothetical protein